MGSAYHMNVQHGKTNMVKRNASVVDKTKMVLLLSRKSMLIATTTREKIP